MSQRARVVALALAAAVAGSVRAPRPEWAAGQSRRLLLRQMALAPWVAPCAAMAQKPFNPLNLKGQFWETGSMIYEKPAREADPDGAARRARAAVEALRGARRDAENGDAAAVLAALRAADVSERTLRLDGAALVDASDDDFLARERLAAAVAAFRRVVTAAEVRADAGRGGVDATVVTALSATGLIYVLPGGPSLVNNALERRQTTSDPGLDVVLALEACIAALSALLDGAPRAPP